MTGARMDRRAVVSWALYDFANSAFTTLVVTFVYATFFTKVIVGDETLGTTLWSRGVSITAITVAVLSPFLGALADRGGFRKLILLGCTLVCIGATGMLYTVMPGQIASALVWFVLANIAYELGCVFYNAYLPDIAPPEQIGRVSGYGWALGYIGGLLGLVLALVALVRADPPWFGFSTEGGENIRATCLLVAAWFAVFSVPMFVFVRDPAGSPGASAGPLVAGTLAQLRRTFAEIRKYRQIVRFLVARLLFNDGLVTVFAFGAIYAQGTFGFSTTEILMFGITLNVTAGLGAFAMGFLDDRFGGKRTIQLSILGLVFGATLAVLAPGKGVFWVAGALLGIFVGPNQSASRSLMGRFVPADKESEFFGFFALSGKATAFVGPMAMGMLTAAFDSQRAGVVAVIGLLVAGLVALTWVDEAEGVQLAGRAGG